MLIGLSTYDSNSGIVYVVYGQTAFASASDDPEGSLFEVEILLSEIAAGNSSYGFAMTGAPWSSFGHSASNAGDVNGDGYDDVIVGAPYLGKYKGAAYVVFGCPAGLSATVIQFTGAAINDQAGWVFSYY